MNRSSDLTRADWLRPSRLMAHAPERPTLIEGRTHPDTRDLWWSTAAAMLLGLLVGTIIIFAIAAA